MTLLPIVLLLAAAPPDAAFTPLRRYEGTWQVSRSNSASSEKPYTLKNDCAVVGRYFVCQQTVDGTPGALAIYIADKEAGHYYTQTILPEGRATGRDELTVEGDRWSFTSRRSQNGQATYYRNLNVFSGRNRIHYERAESTNGKDWQTKASGDQIRLGPNGKPAR